MKDAGHYKLERIDGQYTLVPHRCLGSSVVLDNGTEVRRAIVYALVDDVGRVEWGVSSFGWTREQYNRAVSVWIAAEHPAMVPRAALAVLAFTPPEAMVESDV